MSPFCGHFWLWLESTAVAPLPSVCTDVHDALLVVSFSLPFLVRVCFFCFVFFFAPPSAAAAAASPHNIISFHYFTTSHPGATTSYAGMEVRPTNILGSWRGWADANNIVFFFFWESRCSISFPPVCIYKHKVLPGWSAHNRSNMRPKLQTVHWKGDRGQWLTRYRTGWPTNINKSSPRGCTLNPREQPECCAAVFVGNEISLSSGVCACPVSAAAAHNLFRRFAAYIPPRERLCVIVVCVVMVVCWNFGFPRAAFSLGSPSVSAGALETARELFKTRARWYRESPFLDTHTHSVCRGAYLS